MPCHLILEEAHRYIQADNDTFLLGYNIFDRIAKEGRKYGTILGIISQRPVEISDTVVAQVSNFLIFKMTHPKDLKYIEEMLPNISSDVIEKQKTLQPGSCVAFGGAFKIPMIIRMAMPDPPPYSSNCNVKNCWTKEVKEEIKNGPINMETNQNQQFDYNQAPQQFFNQNLNQVENTLSNINNNISNETPKPEQNINQQFFNQNVSPMPTNQNLEQPNLNQNKETIQTPEPRYIQNNN